MKSETRPRAHGGDDRDSNHHSGSASGGNRTVRVDVQHALMAENDAHAGRIRDRLHDAGVLTMNLISSPGAGKTSLLEATLARLNGRMRVGVIEGDIETRADAERLAHYSIPVVQINTGPFGGDCHLAAPLIDSALREIDLNAVDVVFIENVGNLVCPAEFDVGEKHKVVLLSCTEGEDKPLKYPLAFREAGLVLLTKVDLLPHLDVAERTIRSNVRTANPDIETISLSARTKQGIDLWIEWFEAQLDAVRS